jgi:predicted patatin/cPLA2 family phospholipase
MELSANTLTTIKGNCSPTTPLQGAALVVEGGGQRGIFTAGILDSWLAQDFNPFSILIGTSAGAQNLSTYMSRQSGHAKRSIMQLSKHPKFFNLKRPLLGKNTVDLDWYFNQVNDIEYQLNMDCAQNQLQNRQLLFTATTKNGLCPSFLEPTSDNWMTTLKASSALPYLYKKGVEIENNHYVDGGVALPIPIQEAYHRGARNIIVLRTVPNQESVCTPWAHKLKSWVCTSQRCPKVLDILTRHENAYTQAQDFINSPPEDANVIEIAPSKKLASKLVGSTEESLLSDYEMGFQMGKLFLTSEYAKLFTQK